MQFFYPATLLLFIFRCVALLYTLFFVQQEAAVLQACSLHIRLNTLAKAMLLVAGYWFIAYFPCLCYQP